MRHSSYLEVNLRLLSENFQSVQALAPSATVLPMVKANAYGNGLVPLARFFSGEHNVQKLGVATLGEALEVFREFPDLPVEVIVFSDAELQHPECRSLYASRNITPVLHCPQDLDVVLNDPDLRRLPLHIKLNTGMNRLGFTWDELEPFIPRLKERGVDHLLTHFAYSYSLLRAGDKTSRQVEEFSRMKKNLLDAGVEIRSTSLANSGAIEQKICVNETYVRPGLMLYGPPSVLDPKPLWKGHQISRLVTKVLKTFTAKKGTPIGYGVTVVPQDAFLILIPLGYADGLVTFASGVQLTVNGQVGKLFARINMDMAFIIFDPSAEGKIKTEDVVEIWNHDNRVITDIATQMKTHQYQLMCAISGRIPRIYKVQ